MVLPDLVDLQGDREWTYLACKCCGKKASLDGHGYFCEKCNTVVKYVIPRYMVTAEVVDDSGSCHFLIFNREFQKLAGCLASELKEHAHQQNIPSDYVGGSSFSCRVIRMIDDRDVIDTYLVSLNDYHDGSTHNPGGAVEEQGTSSSVVSGSDKSVNATITREVDVDELAGDPQPSAKKKLKFVVKE
ncbi:uncharacterized protein LOC114733659 [Neltuma alba]|nr:uncharacterized protein LOC114733659 [Prosopis alba]